MLHLSGECLGPQLGYSEKIEGKTKDGFEDAGKDHVNVILSEMGRTGGF